MSRPSRNSKPKPDGVGKSPTEIDHVHVERSEIEETGEFDLDGLLVRLAHSIDSIGAKRVVIGTLSNTRQVLRTLGLIRAEVERADSGQERG